MAGASIIFDIIGRDRASDKFGDVGDSAERTGGKLGKLKGAAMAGATAFAAVGTAAIAGGAYVFNYGAKLQQMEMKANTVFGNQVGAVQSWADKSAHAMGLTTREATGLAAGFADLLIPMGFSRKEAAKMSTDVVGLSGALSQWSGGTKSAAEVTEILNAAMLGETDGLKALGISISAADVEARLLAKGQDKLTGSAKQQAEAQAIQALIMAKSTDAQAAFAKGGSPLLSTQAKLKATFGELRDELITRLVPAVTTLAGWFMGKGLPAMRRFGDYLGGVLPPYVNKAKAALATMGDRLRPIGEWFREHPEVIKGVAIAFGVAAGAAVALGVAMGVVALATSPITLAVVAVAALGGAIAYAWKNSQTFRTAVTNVGAAVQQVMGVIRGAIPPVVNVVKSLWAAFGPTVVAYLRSSFQNAIAVLKGAFTIIRGIFKTVSSLLKGDWKGMWDGIKTILRGSVQLLTGIVRQLWNGIKTAFRLGGTVMKGLVKATWSGIQALTRAGVNLMVSQVRAMPGRLMAVGGLMLRAGKSLIGKLWEGIKGAAGKTGGFVSDLLGQIKSGINNLLNLPLKTPSIKVKGITVLGSTTIIPAFRRGGIAPGGLALVGEEGPELVDLPGGSRVTPHRASMARLAGGGGTVININVNVRAGVGDPVAIGREVETVLAKYQRANGGRPLKVRTT